MYLYLRYVFQYQTQVRLSPKTVEKKKGSTLDLNQFSAFGVIGIRKSMTVGRTLDQNIPTESKFVAKNIPQTSKSTFPGIVHNTEKSGYKWL